MIKVLMARAKQGYRTSAFPVEPPALSDRFVGAPVIGRPKCPPKCSKCVELCPMQCISRNTEKISIDIGKCIFCGKCAESCSPGILHFSKDYRMAVRKREELVLSGPVINLAEELNKEMKKLFGRSLKLRQVCAGGCNACEADVNVLNTLAWDLGRFGIQFVASPRHADGLLVTGPVTENMKLALKKTYEAVANPKLVIAVGACAISGGIYEGHSEANNGVQSIIPVDLFIPGCPPHPSTILDGLLRLMGRLKGDAREKINDSQPIPPVGDQLETRKKLIRSVIRS
ncbi:MAG: hydrogenase [Lentisphaerae bacterium GWF2_44_16]|nr:MAG: hydrogenase [Lentisphaerae bacterium GWF2_44_16]